MDQTTVFGYQLMGIRTSLQGLDSMLIKMIQIQPRGSRERQKLMEIHDKTRKLDKFVHQKEVN